MKFRTKMWSLPIGAAVIFVIGMIISVTVSTRLISGITGLREIHDPYMIEILRLDRSIEHLRLSVQAAVAEGGVDQFGDFLSIAEEGRQAVNAIAKLNGHAVDSTILSVAFETYQTYAIETASHLLRKKEGDSAALIAVMQTSQRTLINLVEVQKTKARLTIEQSYDEAFQGVRMGLWINLITGAVLLILLGLGSWLIVTSVLGDLGEDPAVLATNIKRISSGDLDFDIPTVTNDSSSLHAILAVMAQQLRSMFYKIQEATEVIKQEKQRADAASEYKSMFLANMSHEIRTPMNAVIGLSHLAMRTELTLKQRDYLIKIQQSSQHLLGILNDILDFSKAESGKLNLENVNFELESVLHNMVNVISGKSTGKHLELICDIKSNVPLYLMGDPLRLGQILINYANNAIKFTERGEICVSVRREITHEQPEPGEASDVLLRFEVRDTGIGLSAEQISQLFHSFSQADRSTTRKYGGTGLGLAISKSLTELMGGRVGVTSARDVGSTFWFTARLGLGVAPTRAEWPVEQWKDKRALVVDDNACAAQVLSGMLVALGLRVTVVSSGAQALVTIRDEAGTGADSDDRFDIVLIDTHMPSMGGLETAQRIELEPHGVDCKRILMTAYGDEETLPDPGDGTVNGIFHKPVSATALRNGLQQLLNPHAQTRPMESNAIAADIHPGLLPLRGAKILLVEDNEINQQVAYEILSDAGFVVDIAANGAIAIEYVSKTPYELVLMDMQMPVMDGISATQYIRTNPAYASLPIVAMTANAMQIDRDHCSAAGMNDFVSKPINPDDLWATLVRWIPATSSTRTVPSVPLYTPATESTAAAPDYALTTPVAGLDVALGMQRVMGKQRLYTDMLRKFANTQHTAIESIRTALAAHDLVTAERLAHTLKGLSGNIGATTLQASSGLLETALRTQQAPEVIAPLMVDAASLLTALVASLQQALPTSEDDSWAIKAPAVALDAQAISFLLKQLRTHLEDQDADALDYLTQHRANFQALLGLRYQTLVGAVSNFEFDDALALLEDIA